MEGSDVIFFAKTCDLQTYPIFHFDRTFKFVRRQSRSVGWNAKILLLLDFSLATSPTNVRSKMSLVVNDYWYKCTISGVGSSSLKFTLVTYSKIFVIQPDHRA